MPDLESDLSNLGVVLEASLGNYEIARANADTILALSRAYNASLDAGAAEHDLSQYRLQMLEEERRARRQDKLAWYSIIGILGILSLE